MAAVRTKAVIMFPCEATSDSPSTVQLFEAPEAALDVPLADNPLDRLDGAVSCTHRYEGCGVIVMLGADADGFIDPRVQVRYIVHPRVSP